MKREEFLQRIKQAVLSVDDKAEVILFGSHARGDSKKDSDWDILVLTENKADFHFQRKIRDEICDIELTYNEPISTIIMNEKKWRELKITPLYKNILQEGKKV